MIPCISYLVLLLLSSPELDVILWLPSTYYLVHNHNDDEAQALPHAGTLGLLFLATRAGSRSLCFGIALALQGVHRQASSASWHVLLSHRLEPKLRCMRSICYRRQGSRSETLFLVLSKVHKVTPCFMHMIAHDIVHHRSDCDTNNWTRHRGPFAPPMSCAFGTTHLGKSRSERKEKSAATLVFVLGKNFDPN